MEEGGDGIRVLGFELNEMRGRDRGYYRLKHYLATYIDNISRQVKY